MALIHFDGFENYDTGTPISVLYGTVGVALTSITYQQPGRFADSKSILLSAAGYAGFSYPVTGTAVAVGCSVKQSVLRDFSSYASGFNGIHFESATNSILNDISVAITALGTIEVRRNTTVLGTSAAVVSAGAWYHIGVELIRHATAGSINVYIDGVSVLYLSGINTDANPLKDVIMRMLQTDANYDDFYVCDSASWLGEARVSPLPPNADTAQTDFTASGSGDNYTFVDEQPPNKSDYVSSSTVGAKDLYESADLSFTPLNILGVRLSALAAKDEITTRTIRNILKSGGTSAQGATQALSTSARYTTDVWTKDPNTGEAWTKSGVDALQIGMELVA